MIKTKKIIFLSILSLLLSIPSAAFAATATIQNLTSASPLAKTSVTFNVSVTGFSTPYYSVTDSFPNTSINSTNMNFGGNFQWAPNVSDIGTHTLTINVTDSDGHSASATQQITVLPPPSITIQNVSPQNSMMPGSPFTFTVTSPGFTSPTFVVSDSFGGSSVGNSSISSNGSFSWTPDTSQNGEHAITVYASDVQGHSAQATALIRVGAGPSISAPSNINMNISPGQSLSFTLTPLNYSPTGFSVNDKFSGQTSLTNNSISASGLFQWIPVASDAGQHTVTFMGQIGAYGPSATTSVIINVLGPGGVLIPGPTSVATAATSTGGSVSSLQAQLALLQSKMGSGTVQAQPTTETDFIFTLYLKQGSENDEVRELQKILKKLGYLTVAPNGYFGPATAAAVKKFQAAKGLDQLGAVGAATRLELNSLGGTKVTPAATSPIVSNSTYVFEHFMGVGDDDADVLELQKRLVTLGFLKTEPNGHYGTGTEAAVKKYQTKHGLSATGYVAKNTREALNAQ